jgi:hypothetical protein
MWRTTGLTLAVVMAGTVTLSFAATEKVRMTPVPRARLAEVAARAERDRAKLEELVDTLQRRNARDGKPGRGFHQAGIATAKAEYLPDGRIFFDDSAVYDAIQGGIFADKKKGLLRFSHGRSEGDPAAGRRDQRDPDVRGAGLMFDQGGEAQGVTFTNMPTQVVPKGTDFLRLFEIMSRPGSKAALPFRLARELGTAKALRAITRLSIGALPIPHLFRTQYWGPPIVVGDAGAEGVFVARPTLIPYAKIGAGPLSRIYHGVRNSRLFNRKPLYLSEGAADWLNRGHANFQLALQFYVDDKLTPITDDGDKRWRVPAVKVGLVALPPQVLSPVLQAQTEQAGSAGPQVVAQKLRVPATPVGEFQGARDIAYARSAANRGATPAGTEALLQKSR